MAEIPHVEIPADDLPRAGRFYRTVFGWSSREIPGMNYLQLRVGQGDDQGVGKPVIGGITQRLPPVVHPVFVVNVDDVDACIEKAKEMNGKVLKPKFSVSKFGFSAYIEDTEGNVVGLWQALS